MFFYLFMGPFMLLFSQFSDAIWFLVHAYKWNQAEDEAPNVFHRITLSAFNKFFGIVKGYKGDTCNALELVNQIRSEFNVTECITGLLYSHTKN